MNLLSSFFLCVVVVATLVSGNLPPGIEPHPHGGWTQVISSERYIWAYDHVRLDTHAVIIYLKAPPTPDPEMQQFLEQHVANRYVEVAANNLMYSPEVVKNHLQVRQVTLVMEADGKVTLTVNGKNFENDPDNALRVYFSRPDTEGRMDTIFTRGPLPINFGNHDFKNREDFSVKLGWVPGYGSGIVDTQPVAIRWRFLPKEESSSSSSSLGARRW